MTAELHPLPIPCRLTTEQVAALDALAAQGLSRSAALRLLVQRGMEAGKRKGRGSGGA